MADDRDRKDTTLILPAGEQALVMDASKGTVSIVVGPYQKSLTAGSEISMKFDRLLDRMVSCSISESTMRFPTARQGQYIVLLNPAKDNVHPQLGAITTTADLLMGQRIHIPGPVSFPIWAMQQADVVDGHVLRTDQYLIVEVYDAEMAQKNRDQGFTFRDKKAESTEAQGDVAAQRAELTKSLPTTLGHRFIVKGTEVSFYIPPTGYQVVPEIIDGVSNYVRTAVSLERLEYCTLLDENGGRRIEIGPAVVFPTPTETFITEALTDGSGRFNTKFRAIELDEIKGIHVKVTQDYIEDDEAKTERKRGDELFITGKEQLIYFPRPEHSIISYGNSVVKFGIAIPAGEARYVLNRKEGSVKLVEGPITFLPNPILEVIAQRILTPSEAHLFYPGNQAAAQLNDLLREKSTSSTMPLTYGSQRPEETFRSARLVSSTPGGGAPTFDRGDTYTPPRTVVLGSKFDGAVKIEIWPGYAVQVVNGKGERRVVVGPSTIMLQYDETLHRFGLSTGTPKTDKALVEGVYLQVTANSVSDRVEVETGDLCRFSLSLSYRVNFAVTHKDKWFNVSNYVGLLVTTLRSMLRKAAKNYGVAEFQQRATDIIRDLILKTAPAEGGQRPGMTFEENGMHVYDVDVLEVTVQDQNVLTMITRDRIEQLQHEMTLASLHRRRKAALETAAGEEEAIQTKIKLAIEQAKADTFSATAEAEVEALKQKLAAELEKSRAESDKVLAEINSEIELKNLELQKLKDAARLEALQKEIGIEVEAYKARMGAIDGKLAEALIHVGNAELMEHLSKNLSIQQILGGDNLVDVFQKAVGNTTVGDALKKFMAGKPALT